MNAALAYTRAHPPSLQGFVHWLRQSAAEVKREAEGAGHAVRVMTVHGAKGLQAPLVILPDTTALPPDEDRVFWAEADAMYACPSGRRARSYGARWSISCVPTPPASAPRSTIACSTWR